MILTEQDVQDQRCEGIKTDIISKNEHISTYSIQQSIPDPHTDME